MQYETAVRRLGFGLLVAAVFLQALTHDRALAGPRSARASDDPIEVHRAAARALLALGDVDGAWLELSAAFHQSCDARQAAADQVPVDARSRPHASAYPRMGDALLPVPTLLTIRRKPTTSVNVLDADGLVPFYSVFRTLDDGEDDLVSFEAVFARPRARGMKQVK